MTRQNGKLSAMNDLSDDNQVNAVIEKLTGHRPFEVKGAPDTGILGTDVIAMG